MSARTSSRVLARAVSELAVLLEYCLPLVKTGGRFIAMKGERWAEELEAAGNAMNELGVAAPELVSSPVGPGAQLVFDKEHAIPERYPRREGLPKKRPL